MINSFLDNDAYKLAMAQVLAHQYPYHSAEYTFIDRGQRTYPSGFASELRLRVNHMASISMRNDEKEFLRQNMPWISPPFLDFLYGYRFDPNEVDILQTEDRKLELKIRGPHYRTIFWEVPLMATISELWFEMKGNVPDSSWRDRCRQKGYNLSHVRFSDFGTRRRFSYEVQREAIQELLDAQKETQGVLGIIGTSNMHFAQMYKIRPIGTQAHEHFMMHGAMFGYHMATKLALESWVREFQGSLGIALTDTYGTDEFFRSFGLLHAKLFDGVRQDSGSPDIFAEKTIAHYEKLGIDPRSKTIVFSDSLNADIAIRLHALYSNRINIVFGIGTNITNDVGAEPLNIVIKLTAIIDRGIRRSCVKLSDNPGKNTGDTEEVARCIEEIKRGV